MIFAKQSCPKCLLACEGLLHVLNIAVFRCKLLGCISSALCCLSFDFKMPFLGLYHVSCHETTTKAAGIQLLKLNIKMSATDFM